MQLKNPDIYILSPLLNTNFRSTDRRDFQNVVTDCSYLSSNILVKGSSQRVYVRTKRHKTVAASEDDDDDVDDDENEEEEVIADNKQASGTVGKPFPG